MSIENKIRSLTRNEIKVLYWKLQGEHYGEIATRYGKLSVKWAQGLMTSVYKKLGVPKGSTAPEIAEFLRVNKVREIVRKLVNYPEALEEWPLHGEDASAEDTSDIQDPEISADVLAETMAEERQLPVPPIDPDEYGRLQTEIERLINVEH